MPRSLVLDAFAAPGLAGNPAAVVLDEAGRPDAWRQALAHDFGFSETAFVTPLKPGRWALRWFTPTVEVRLCGHATLATVQALATWGLLPADGQAVFETLSGELRCAYAADTVRMDFPAAEPQSAEAPPALLPSLGLPAERPCFRAGEDYLVLAQDAAEIRALRPDFAALARVPCRGVCVTASAEAGSGADFVSRFFGPRAGIDEDPVTGSAHCYLGPYWGRRLGKSRLLGRQLSACGGEVGVELLGAGRLWLSGQVRLREGQA